MNRPFFRRDILPALCLLFLLCRFLNAQSQPQPLNLEGFTLNGMHSFLTDSWVTVELTVTNPNTEGRDGRVVVFYADRPDVQYARDVWVPGKSTLSTWMAVGPAPKKESGIRGQGSGNREQGSEVKDQKSEVGSRKSEAESRIEQRGIRDLGVRGKDAAAKGQESGVRGQGSEVRSQRSEIRDRKSDVGPASGVQGQGAQDRPPGSRYSPMELQALIYERTGDKERLLLPRTEERVRSRMANYQPREPVTALLLDVPKTEYVFRGGEITTKVLEANDVVDLVRAVRGATSLSEHVRLITDEFLPPTADAFDGVDHFVLASRRLADDPPGQVALSRWLEQGGRLWVMLDRTDPDAVAAVLGIAPGFHIVDRTSLTRVRIDGRGLGSRDLESAVREFEQPVDFVRVELGPEFTVLHRVNGWPASFSRTIGRGKVLITTLGMDAWCRPRTADDPRSPFDLIPDVPVLMPAMEYLSQQFQPSAAPTFPSLDLGTKEGDAFAPLVIGDIGYSIVGVSTASMVFGGFLVMLLVLALGLRKWGRLEMLSWIGPVAALSTGLAFVALGEVSRQAVSPTVAVAQRIAVNPQNQELSVTGLLGFYRPNGGPANIRTTRGGLLELDMSGLEGQTRRMVTTDIDAWHWENLTLPAGVRLGWFRSVARAAEPVSCVAGFGPSGLEGKLSARAFSGLGDILIQAPSRRVFSVRPTMDGSFTIGANDLLSAGQFVPDAVLSDHQQKRQAIYRQLLTDPQAPRPSEDSVLFAWADPMEAPFDFETELRSMGSALISIPVELRHTTQDTAVIVPRAFISYRRILETGPIQPTLEGTDAIEEHLRFQLPLSVLPLHVEKARLIAKVEAPSRRFTVSVHTKNGLVKLHSVQSPIDPVPIDIVGDDLLLMDEQGGLNLVIAVSEPPSVDDGQLPKWDIQALELEVVGRTLKR